MSKIAKMGVEIVRVQPLEFGEVLGKCPQKSFIYKGLRRLGNGFKSRRLNQKIQYIVDVLYFFIVSATSFAETADYRGFTRGATANASWK